MPVATVFLLLSCNGILDGIYDDFSEQDKQEQGFIELCSNTADGTIYIDARSYERWCMIDFHHSRTDTVSITQEEPDPDDWDIAIHRYDVKTNGGGAIETGCNNIAEAIASMTQNDNIFVYDIADSIVTDMSTMMDGHLVKCPSNINPVLSRWLCVDISTMPPIYTMSNHVYIVRFNDGTMAALLFSNYLSPKSEKGYITIRYRYPIN